MMNLLEIIISAWIAGELWSSFIAATLLAGVTIRNYRRVRSTDYLLFMIIYLLNFVDGRSGAIISALNKTPSVWKIEPILILFPILELIIGKALNEYHIIGIGVIMGVALLGLTGLFWTYTLLLQLIYYNGLYSVMIVLEEIFTRFLAD